MRTRYLSYTRAQIEAEYRKPEWTSDLLRRNAIIKLSLAEKGKHDGHAYYVYLMAQVYACVQRMRQLR